MRHIFANCGTKRERWIERNVYASPLFLIAADNLPGIASAKKTNKHVEAHLLAARATK